MWIRVAGSRSEPACNWANLADAELTAGLVPARLERVCRAGAVRAAVGPGVGPGGGEAGVSVKAAGRGTVAAAFALGAVDPAGAGGRVPGGGCRRSGIQASPAIRWTAADRQGQAGTAPPCRLGSGAGPVIRGLRPGCPWLPGPVSWPAGVAGRRCLAGWFPPRGRRAPRDGGGSSAHAAAASPPAWPAA